MLEVNLDPSAAQKVALVNLLRKLPGSSGLHGSDGSFQDWVGRTLSDGADSGTGNGTGSGDGLDFARDVQPWLGSQVAVAAVPSGQKSSPVDAVLVVQEKDDAAAAAAMDKLRAHGSPDLGYVVKDGYLVVTPDSRTGATRVVTAAEKGSLADDAHFAADTASLGSEEVLTAWADAGRLSDLLRQQLQVHARR